jgi:DNA-directed RNA polymerase alpha subunit
LRQFSEGTPESAGHVAGAVAFNNAPVVFVFSGNGSQFPEMGHAAYSEHARFRSEIAEIDALFQPLASLTMVEEPGLEPEPSAEAQIPLEELNLSVRAYNCLKRAQVNSVSDLMGFSYEDLLEIKNFGSKSADEVIEALERIGITLPQSRTSA